MFVLVDVVVLSCFCCVLCVCLRVRVVCSSAIEEGTRWHREKYASVRTCVRACVRACFVFVYLRLCTRCVFQYNKRKERSGGSELLPSGTGLLGEGPKCRNRNQVFRSVGIGIRFSEEKCRNRNQVF